jgi:Mn2+/Fe2+ NRAMP family transporter
LPVGLALVLIASRNSKVVGNYIHPLVLQVLGWLVVLVMAFFSVKTLVG